LALEDEGMMLPHMTQRLIPEERNPQHLLLVGHFMNMLVLITEVSETWVWWAYVCLPFLSLCVCQQYLLPFFLFSLINKTSSQM
jgi:hypothetical protein